MSSWHSEIAVFWQRVQLLSEMECGLESGGEWVMGAAGNRKCCAKVSYEAAISLWQARALLNISPP